MTRGRCFPALDTAALAGALLGRDLPPAAEDALRHAGPAYAEAMRRQNGIFTRRRLAPDHPAVLIGLSLLLLQEPPGRCAGDRAACLLKPRATTALTRTGGGCDRKTRSSAATMPPRRGSIMFTLKAYAYLQLRLGDLEEGRDAALKIARAGSNGKVGAAFCSTCWHAPAPMNEHRRSDRLARRTGVLRHLLAPGSAGRPASCRLKHACVHDRYARRIDRFFGWNPSLAKIICAIRISRCAPSRRNPPMCSVAGPADRPRGNGPLERRCCGCPTAIYSVCATIRTGRSASASPPGCDAADLSPMIHDADYYVRLVVARRIATGDAAADAQRSRGSGARVVLAQRIADAWLPRHCRRSEPTVRLEADPPPARGSSADASGAMTELAHPS